MHRFLEHILLNYLLGQVKPLNRPETVDNIGQPMYAEPEISVYCTTEITEISKRCLKEGTHTHTHAHNQLQKLQTNPDNVTRTKLVKKNMDVCIFICE